MKPHAMIWVGLILLTLFQAPAQAEDRLHPWETPIDLSGSVQVNQEHLNSARIKLDFRTVQCIERVELELSASSGRPTGFVIGTDAYVDEALSQDIEIASLGTASHGSTRYSFRVNRMLSQAAVLIGGGSVRVLRAKGISVPDYRCPMMANHMAETWGKTASQVHRVGTQQIFSIEFRMFLADLKVATDTLSTISNGLPGLTAERHRAPDTNPDVQKAATDLACLVQVNGEAVFAAVSPTMTVYQQVALPLFSLRDQIAMAYSLGLDRTCPKRQ